MVDWRRRRLLLAASVAAIALLPASLASADVFHMPAGDKSLQFVTVGDPGNAADATGYGAVGHTYWMGKYDVTTAQYCQFLNAVAKTDPEHLYTSLMATPGTTGSIFGCGIIRTGGSGNCVGRAQD